MHKLTEKEFQQTVVDLAHHFGWIVAHFRPARTIKGWRTPVAFDAEGYPDLTLLRDRIIVFELGVEGKELAPAQRRWLEAFDKAGGEAYFLLPSDMEEIKKILGRQR